MLEVRSYRLKLLDLVVLKEDLPDRGLRRGNIGTIVEIFDDQAYEVEFIDEEGQTLALFALRDDQILPLSTQQYDLIEDLQAIFAELDQTYPENPTLAGIKTLERIENTPSLKQTIINTGKESGIEAIEAALDHPAVTITMAGIKGFIEA